MDPTPMENALSLLKGVFLVMPLVGILLQTMINFYSNNNPSIQNYEKQRTLHWAVGGFGLLFLAGLLIIVFLFQTGLSPALSASAFILLLGLGAFGIALYAISGHVMSSLEGDDS